jgi:outer membrane lipoprotein-sorting protein
MRKARLLIVVLLLAAVMLNSACGILAGGEQKAQEQNAYERIQQTLTGLTSYRCMATVEYKANKGSNSYETVQHGRITGEYRIEVVAPEKVAGSVTCSDGSKIYQFSTQVNGRVSLLAKETQERSEIFLTSFIKNYMRSQEVSVSVANLGEGKCTVLEAVIPGGHPYLSSEKLWMDNETFKPVQLIIYDPEGKERIVVTYSTVEYNVELDDALFTV